ncbi:hypothetical protein [Microbacterium sp. NPDC087665]|uniref:hypothetical protein n=1 Tax=Microbacterium sp. NPDC087665 TaxID=3364194 RepID=UPI0038072750
MLAGILGVSILAGVAAAPAVQTTEARFLDTEEVASSTFTALKLAPPQITAVVNCSGLLGLGLANGVTLDWTMPVGAAYTGFTPANNVQWAFNSAGTNWQAVTTTSPSAGVYRTTFNTGVINDLLSLLLGGTMTFQVRTKVGTNWVSTGASKVTLTNALINPTCSAPVNGT